MSTNASIFRWFDTIQGLTLQCLIFLSTKKSLASKSKEVSLQSVRLSELETLIAKNASSPMGGGRGRKALDFRSSEEFNAMQEENRVVSLGLSLAHSIFLICV